MNTFAEMMKNLAQNDRVLTKTTNGATALSTTNSALVDLFGTIGAMRHYKEDDIIQKVKAAMAEDPVLTLKMLFYARDVRGGLGERRVFRIAIHYLAVMYSEYVKKVIPFIGFYGRFDDLYELLDTSCEDAMWSYMSAQFKDDLNKMKEGEPISLLAKWIKTPDASSQRTRYLGIVTAKKLGYTVYEFKRLLRKMRKYLRVVERQMSANLWSGIDYEIVPARAAMLYRRAFARHDEIRYRAYIDKVSAGKAKINAATLYPYDIVERIWHNGSYEDRQVLEAQWKSLPNYVEGENNVLIMADVSGSMWGRPICTSIGLAIYFAERNKGAYKDLFLTFSERPQFVKIDPTKSLYEKIRNAEQADWGNNTNLASAFDRILDLAVRNNISQKDLPKSLIIITDMEFDRCVSNARSWETFYESMSRRYREAGYILPNVVFWNVNSVQDTFHADANRRGVQLVSGQSTAVFKTLMGSVDKTPYEYMLYVLDDERYSIIEYALSSN